MNRVPIDPENSTYLAHLKAYDLGLPCGPFRVLNLATAPDRPGLRVALERRRTGGAVHVWIHQGRRVRYVIISAKKLDKRGLYLPESTPHASALCLAFDAQDWPQYLELDSAEREKAAQTTLDLPHAYFTGAT